ncbi:MAG: hypothetical protein BWY39_00082 [Spirochaetes bacterium ADurb.Bin269]|nr:MAG: hypothetical protein BWY39_00082 [Spirochaetes bacterium ADurb.Bin269]
MLRMNSSYKSWSMLATWILKPHPVSLSSDVETSRVKRSEILLIARICRLVNLSGRLQS